MKSIVRNKNIVTFRNILGTYKSKYHGRKALEKYRHWFPLHLSSKLAGIVADLMCDGHLQSQPKLRLDYTSKNKNELRRFGKEVYNIFNIGGKIRPCKTNKYGISYNYGINCKPLGRILFFIGVPTGAKVSKPFRVPIWIARNKNYFKIFVQRVFDCEGTVWNDKYGFIGIEMWKEKKLVKNGIEFFDDIRRCLLKYYKIDTTNVFIPNSKCNRKDDIKTVPLRFYVKKKSSIYKFYRNIGFNNGKKQFKLMKLINHGDRNGTVICF